MVCASVSLAARACRAKKVIVAAALVDICAFHLCACHLYFLGPGLDGESVFRQFDAVNTVERAPEHVVFSSVLNKELVDAVGYFLRAVDDNAAVGKRSGGLVSRCNAYLVGPVVAPYANRCVENISASDEVDVGSPHHSPRREVRRTCGIVEGCAYLCPLYQVFASENRHVSYVFSTVKVEESVGSLNHSRVGNAAADDGIVIRFLQCGNGCCASSLPGMGWNGIAAARRTTR